MKGKESKNASRNFALTFYLQEYTAEMKEKEGIEPKASDFVDAFHDLQLKSDELKIKSMICQVERGSNGTIHLQGYLQMEKRIRISTLSKRIKANTKFHGNLLVARGSARDNVEYCSKPTGDWTYSDGKVKHSEQLTKPMWINEAGFNMVKGQRNDLKTAIRAIEQGASMLEVWKQYPSTGVRNHRGLEKYHFTLKQSEFKQERLGRLIVLHGNAGSGKSWASRHILTKELGLTSDDVYSLQFDSNTIWFDGYNGEKILLIDDYEPKQIKRNQFLRITDIYPFNGQIKGGHIVAQWDYVIVTTNYDPHELFLKTVDVEFTDENGRVRTESEDVPDDAVFSRIWHMIDYTDMPDRRRKDGLYQTTKATPSVASLLPATLTHDTQRPEADCGNGAMQECEDAILTPKPQDSTLTHFDNLGTKIVDNSTADDQEILETEEVTE